MLVLCAMVGRCIVVEAGSAFQFCFVHNFGFYDQKKLTEGVKSAALAPNTPHGIKFCWK